MDVVDCWDVQQIHVILEYNAETCQEEVSSVWGVRVGTLVIVPDKDVIGSLVLMDHASQESLVKILQGATAVAGVRTATQVMVPKKVAAGSAVLTVHAIQEFPVLNMQMDLDVARALLAWLVMALGTGVDQMLKDARAILALLGCPAVTLRRASNVDLALLDILVME